MRGKSSSLRRKRPIRSVKRKFILFSEGANTEKVYFNAIRNYFPDALIEVDFIGPAGVPKTIAKKVKERMAQLKKERKANSFAQNDTVWAVFDRDEHDDVAQSIEQCKSAGADIAYSNPCFEIWLILHHQHFDKADDRHQVQKHFATIDPSYDPNGAKTPNCEALMDNIENAEKRAIKQGECRENEGSPMGRPSTTVYKLTQAIREAAEMVAADKRQTAT